MSASWRVSRATLCTGESLPGGAGQVAKLKLHRGTLEVRSAHESLSLKQLREKLRLSRWISVMRSGGSRSLTKVPLGRRTGGHAGTLWEKIHRKLRPGLESEHFISSPSKILQPTCIYIFISPVILCQDSRPGWKYATLNLHHPQSGLLTVTLYFGHDGSNMEH